MKNKIEDLRNHLFATIEALWVVMVSFEEIMSERTFEHFPEHAECPLCATNDDKECCLVPVDGTSDERICEAQPMHVDCVKRINLFRYNKEIGILYRKN